MEMQIESGKSYRTRAGKKAIVTELNGRYFVAKIGNWAFAYRDGGECANGQQQHDIVAEWTEPATPGADGWIEWHGGECPVPGGTVVEVRYRGQPSMGAYSAKSWEWDQMGGAGDIVAYRIVRAVAPLVTEPALPITDETPQPATAAPDFLAAAAGHMQDRASTYDSAAGERSMARTVGVFNALHGTALTEAQGWNFMECLKMVRAFQGGGFHRDSIEDMAAYVALRGEAQAREGGAS